MRLGFRFLAVSALVLAGCATPRSAVKDGTAKLVPNSVTIGIDHVIPRNSAIFGVIESPGQSDTISTLATDCRRGSGSISFNSGYLPIDNLRLAGDTPADRMFKDLCASLPRIEKYFAPAAKRDDN